MSAVKGCTRCLIVKPVAEFSLSRAASDGLQHWCKACSSEYRAAWDAAHPQASHERTRKWRALKQAAAGTPPRPYQLHGHGGGKRSPEYIAWRGAKARTTNPHNKQWEDYGGRGIGMAPEWLNDFRAFLEHIGPKPSSEFTLDRIDNELGYQPGNVRWADRETQARNKRARPVSMTRAARRQRAYRNRRRSVTAGAVIGPLSP